jgi:PadR family transcriptional regulator PadR
MISRTMNLKGTLPLLVLKVLRSGPKHGYRIAQEIKNTSKGVLDFKEGTLYPTLHSQENKGLIESFEQTEKGRTRRYYRLTEDGLRVLEVETREWEQLSVAIDMVLERI